MTTNNITDTEAPELLYHVKRTIIDFAQDKSGATRNTDILGTFTDLAAAKAAAHSALSSEGYVKDDFSNYEENDGIKDWEHGDGVIVFAKAPAGQEFEVGLSTTPNVLLLKGNISGEVQGFLHYVLQTTIHYNMDRTGGIQTTEVEGVYPIRKAAFEAAKNSLLDEDVTKDSFVEYEEKDDDEMKDEWPYGDEVLVHAVANTAENFQISVKTRLHSHRQHGSKHHERHQTVKESK